MAEKKYLKGSGKSFTFDDGNEILNFSIVPSQLIEFLKEVNKQRAADGEEPSEYLNIVVAKKAKPGQWGDTHYAYVRPYFTPKKKKPTQGNAASGGDGDELPF